MTNNFARAVVAKLAADETEGKPGLLSRVGAGLSGVARKAVGLIPAGIVAYLGMKGLSRGATEAVREPETEEEKRQAVLRRLRQI